MRDISVIIVSWNAREFLRQCLVSIATHASDRVGQVIVVDNASSDGSADMVAREFPAVELVCETTNLGFARANNLGIARARGATLALINSDVVVHAGCVQTLAGYLDAHPDTGLVGPAVYDGAGERQISHRRFPSFWRDTRRTLALDALVDRFVPRFKNDVAARDVDVLSGCFLLARRTAVDDVGLLDPRFFFYAEDVDWCKRFNDKGWKVTLVPSATATHFGGGSSSQAPVRFSVEMLRANIAYWGKHYGLIGQLHCYLQAIVHHAIRLPLRRWQAAVGMGDRVANAYKYTRSKSCLVWLFTGKLRA